MKPSTDSQAINSTEQLKTYIRNRSDICEAILCYVDSSDENVIENRSLLLNIRKELEEKQVLANKNEFWRFLKTICYVSSEHQPTKKLLSRIEGIIELFINEIQEIFSQKEIFKLFGFKFRRLLLFLFEKNVIGINTIHEQIKTLKVDRYSTSEDNKRQYILKFFYPEIRKHDIENFNKLMRNREYTIKEFVEVNDQNLERFYILRKENENSSEICRMIREDKIDEFIYFIETTETDLNKLITRDEIFSRVSFLRKKEITLIELSALFGSIKIFKFLYLHNVEIPIHHIFDYAIQGRNSEIIHILEDNKDIQTDISNNISEYLGRALLCFHNDIFRFLRNSYTFHKLGEIIEFTITTGNYLMLNELINEGAIDLNDGNILNIMFSLHCDEGNTEIVQLLIKMPNININYGGYVLFLVWFGFGLINFE